MFVKVNKDIDFAALARGFMLRSCIKYAFLVFFLASFSVAQDRSPSIIVSVTDQLSAVVVKAKVSLLKDNKLISEAMTDKNGNAVFKDIPAGEYKITVEAKGLNKYEKVHVVPKENSPLGISIKLDVETIKVEAEIEGDELLRRLEDIDVLTEEDIAKLPDDPEMFERVLRQMAGPSVTGEKLPVTVEGFDDEIPPKESIRFIRFDRNIFSAQHERKYGGGIQIYTKSDTKTFGYYSILNFSDAALNASNPYIFRKPPFTNISPSFHMIGPLFPGKAAFTAKYNHTNTRTDRAINAAVLDSELKPVYFRGTGRRSVISNTFRFNLKADPADRHSLYASYQLSNSNLSGDGVGGFNLSSRALKTNNTFHGLKISETFFVNAKIVNQTLFRFEYSRRNKRANNEMPAIIVQDAFFGGGAQLNSNFSEKYFNLKNDTTWSLEKNELRFGGAIRGRLVSRDTRSNFGGTYIFTGRQAPALDNQNRVLLDENGNALNVPISSIESYRRTKLFTKLGYSSRRIRNLGGGPTQLTISAGDPRISSNQFDAAFYAQGRFKLNKESFLSVGLRYENQSNINSNFNIAPRIGFAWSPKSDAQNPLYALPTVRVGFGIFYSRFPLENFLDVQRTNAADRKEFLVANSSVLEAFPKIPSIKSLEQFTSPRISRRISTKLQTPFQTLFNVRVNKKLPKNYRVKFLYSLGRRFRQPLTRNINAPLSGSGNFPLGGTGFLYETASLGKGKWSNVSIDLSLLDQFKIDFLDLKLSHLQMDYGYYTSSDDFAMGSGNPVDAYDFSNEFSKSSSGHGHGISGSFILESGLGIILMPSIYYWSGGRRFNIITGRDTNGDGLFTERPAFASDLSKEGLVQTEYGLLDPNPTDGENIIPRNIGKAPSSLLIDASISKSFRFGRTKNGKSKITTRLSLFITNLTNTNNKGNPNGNMSSPNFLRSLNYNNSNLRTTASTAGIFSGFGGRTLNFSLRVSF